MVVEFFVLFGGDVRFGACPQGSAGADLFFTEIDGKGDVVGIGLNDVFEFERVEVGFGFGLDEEFDARAAGEFAFGFGDGEFAVAV